MRDVENVYMERCGVLDIIGLIIFRLYKSYSVHGKESNYPKEYQKHIKFSKSDSTCRDPEAILDWMQTNQIILKEAVYKHGEMDLPEIF